MPLPIPEEAQVSKLRLMNLHTSYRSVESHAHACPLCGGRETWRSRRKSLRDMAAALVLTAPFRCRHCLRRFYVFLPRLGA